MYDLKLEYKNNGFCEKITGVFRIIEEFVIFVRWLEVGKMGDTAVYIRNYCLYLLLRFADYSYFCWIN